MYSRVILSLFVLAILIIVIQYNKPIEFFVNPISNTDLPFNIWMYWENKPERTKPKYLELCYQTIVKHNQNFNINLLNEKSIMQFLPELRNDINRLSIPQKADYIRLSLLHKYGGIWLDSDTIVMQNLTPLLEKLLDHDFVGFGCTGPHCSRTKTGYPYPSNWVLIARKNSVLMQNCLKEADRILTYEIDILKRKYHLIGRILLWNQIKKLKMIDKTWDYFHQTSICTERDSSGEKYRNFRFLSNENYDTICEDKTFFIPVYNTAPGFPDWFMKSSENEIKKKTNLFSKLINKSLS